MVVMRTYCRWMRFVAWGVVASVATLPITAPAAPAWVFQ